MVIVSVCLLVSSGCAPAVLVGIGATGLSGYLLGKEVTRETPSDPQPPAQPTPTAHVR